MLPHRNKQFPQDHMKKISKFMVNILQTVANHEPRIWEDSHR